MCPRQIEGPTVEGSIAFSMVRKNIPLDIVLGLGSLRVLSALMKV